MSSIEPSLIDFSDEAFDAFWDEEARNPNRNRIRIGRQYQAQVAPILKSGESDGRRLEDLETLTWNPHNPLSATQLRDYFAIAQSIGLFVQAVDTCHEGGLDEEEDDLEEDLQEERPFEILRLDPTTTNSSEVDANSIFSTGNHHHHQNQSKVGSGGSNAAAAAATSELHTKASITTRQQRLQQQQKSSVESAEAGGGGGGTSGNASSSSSSSSSSLSPLKHTTNTRIQTAFKGLSHFIAAHHSPAKDGKRCKLSALTSTASSTSSPSSSSSTTTPSPTLTTSADAVTAAAGHSHSQPSQNPPINLGESEQFSSKTLSSLLLGVWSSAEAKIFARALTVCGKNFSAIKKDHLPWKSVHSIIEFYYLSVDKEREAELQGSGSSRNKRSPNNSKQPQQPDRGSSKSPLDEGKQRKQRSSTTRDHHHHHHHHNQSGAKQESSTTTTTTTTSENATTEVNKTEADQQEQPTSGGGSGNSNGETATADSGGQATSSSVDSLSKTCSDGGGGPLFSRALPAWNGSLGGSSASALFSVNGNGNINGNHVQRKGMIGGGGEQQQQQPFQYHQSKRNSGTNSGGISAQEVKPLKARPITSAGQLQQQQQLLHDGLSANGAAVAGADSFPLGHPSSSMLGSLNLYLHGELVLKLNAQQQAETGREKWVESMEANLASSLGTTHNSKRKRHSTSTTSVSANGLAAMGSRMGSGLMPSTSSLKRTIDAKVTQLFRDVVEGDDGDGSSLGGGVGGGSGELLSGGSDDDDSMTSTESSSLVASSPSSSSTIHSAAKKARVKVENLNNCTTAATTTSNGNSCSVSPPTNSSSSSSNPRASGKRSTVSPNLNCNTDNDLELKKRILEANLSLLSNSLPMFFGGNAAGIAAAAAAAASLPAGLGGLFEPPKAHSNPNAPHLQQQFSPSQQQHSLAQMTVSSGTASPGKGTSERGPISSSSTLAKNSTSSSSKESTMNGGSGSQSSINSNGFGPVDLTSRKSSSSSNGSNLHGDHLRSPPPLSSSPARPPRSAHQQQQQSNNSSAATSHSPVPKAAHQESSSSLSPGAIGHRLSPSSSAASALFGSHSLFSLPAPPNVGSAAAALSPSLHGGNGGSGSGSSKAHLKKSNLGLRTGGVQFAK